MPIPQVQGNGTFTVEKNLTSKPSLIFESDADAAFQGNYSQAGRRATGITCHCLQPRMRGRLSFCAVSGRTLVSISRCCSRLATKIKRNTSGAGSFGEAMTNLRLRPRGCHHARRSAISSKCSIPRMRKFQIGAKIARKKMHQHSPRQFSASRPGGGRAWWSSASSGSPGLPSALIERLDGYSTKPEQIMVAANAEIGGRHGALLSDKSVMALAAVLRRSSAFPD